MERDDYSNVTGTSSNPSRGDDNQPIAISAPWDTLTHEGKAAFLHKKFQVYPEETTVATDTEVAPPFLTSPATVSKAPSKLSNERYVAIMRRHHIAQIVEWIQKVYPLVGSPGASIYIKKILLTISNLEDKSPDDPALEILFALYDALAYDGLWTTYTAEQYKKVEQIISEIPTWSISSSDIDTAINALDDAGLEILPFEFSQESQEFEDEL